MDTEQQLIESFLRCYGLYKKLPLSLQAGVEEMLAIYLSPLSDAQEMMLARHTIQEALFPSPPIDL